LLARDSISPLGTGTRGNVELLARLSVRTQIGCARKVYENTNIPGLFLLKNPSFMRGPRARVPLAGLLCERGRARFSIRKYSAFWCSKPLRPSEWHYGNGRVIRRIPTGISTFSFTTFEAMHWSTSDTRYSSCDWCTLSSKTCSNDSRHSQANASSQCDTLNFTFFHRPM